MANRDDDFLARWSRRKLGARARAGGGRDDAAPNHAPESASKPAPESASAPGEASEPPADPQRAFAEELRREERMAVVAVNSTPAAHEDEFDTLTPEQRAEFADVDFDKLTPEDDFTRFMKEGVPEIVRRRALRALWSHPVLSSVDRLNDYDEDFTDAALAIKIVGSNYKPGSGYLTDEERARYNMDGDATTAETAQAPRDDDAPGDDARDDDSGEDDAGEETAARDETAGDEQARETKEAGEGSESETGSETGEEGDVARSPKGEVADAAARTGDAAPEADKRSG